MSTENSPTPANPNKTLGHSFGVLEGKLVVSGKSRYPDFLRLEIPRKDVITLAMDLLRQVEQPPQDNDPIVSISLFGKMERVEEDDLTHDSSTAEPPKLP
jgi:hypothetical protein